MKSDINWTKPPKVFVLTIGMKRDFDSFEVRSVHYSRAGANKALQNYFTECWEADEDIPAPKTLKELHDKLWPTYWGIIESFNILE